MKILGAFSTGMVTGATLAVGIIVALLLADEDDDDGGQRISPDEDIVDAEVVDSNYDEVEELENGWKVYRKSA